MMLEFILGVVACILGLFIIAWIEIEKSHKEFMDLEDDVKHYPRMEELRSEEKVEELKRLEKLTKAVRNNTFFIEKNRELLERLFIEDFFKDYPDFEGKEIILRDKAKSFEKLKQIKEWSDNAVRMWKENMVLRTHYTSKENYKKYKSLIKKWEKEVEDYKSKQE